MIVDYYRPDSLEEAIQLLCREKPKTIPLGGGVSISQRKEGELAVVDLQKLNLNKITEKDGEIVIGSTISTQELIDSSIFSNEIKEVIKHESTTNLRQVATLAGTLVTADGHSFIGTIFSALGATLVWEPGNIRIPFAELEKTRKTPFKGKLITHILIPKEFGLKVEAISNSPDSNPKIIVVHMQTSQENVFAFGGDTEKPIRVKGREINEFLVNAHRHYFNNNYSKNYLLSTIKKLVDRL
jgi:CO/xanthine dehydrogenase FAD-binding subunit